MKKNQRHQVKSKFYYIFWGICTVSVVLGQIYVGSGYREMKDSTEDLTKTLIYVLSAI
jgi:hypothetical protein